MLALAFGWKATSALLVWLTHSFSSRMNATADIMSSGTLGFILGAALMIVIFYNFGQTLKIVAWGLVIGFIGHWIALLIMESKHMDTNVWWMVIDRGAHLVALAVHQVGGVFL